MNKHFGLSDIEYELMSFFWKQETPVAFAEILHFCNDIKGWNWATTTAHTHVTRLVRKKLLDVNKNLGERRTYFAKVSREELAQNSARELINTSFSGSLKNLLVSLVPNRHLSRSEVEELHQILDQLVEQEEKPSDSSKS